MTTIQSLRLNGLLSFAPDSRPIDLQPLNVLIGPNGSGKSNVVEALKLLKAAPSDLSEAIREGGGPAEWLWKGSDPPQPAAVEAVLDAETPTGRPLLYRLEFGSVQGRLEVLDEAIEEPNGLSGEQEFDFYYRFQRGIPVMCVRDFDGERMERHIRRTTIEPGRSILAQRTDADMYPEVTWVAKRLSAIHSFRAWSFRRSLPLRKPQPPDLPEDRLLPDSRNLALLLNQIEQHDGRVFNEYLRQFFPRFDGMSTMLRGGTLQFCLHEKGFKTPIPATRLSDGTIRFMAILATLISPSPAPLVCIEEPELGLHPDAVSLIAELLNAAADKTQLIVTTHSDALVSALTSTPEAIVACERLGEATVLRRVDAERLGSWLDNYALGDLWRMGELGANP